MLDTYTVNFLSFLNYLYFFKYENESVGLIFYKKLFTHESQSW